MKCILMGFHSFIHFVFRIISCRVSLLSTLWCISVLMKCEETIFSFHPYMKVTLFLLLCDSNFEQIVSMCTNVVTRNRTMINEHKYLLNERKWSERWNCIHAICTISIHIVAKINIFYDVRSVCWIPKKQSSGSSPANRKGKSA